MHDDSIVAHLCFFVCKKMGARFLEISRDEIQQLAEKSVNRNTIKTTKTWIKVWKMWATTMGS